MLSRSYSESLLSRGRCDHVACAVAGITSDANILVNYCRLASQRYLFQYDEPVPLENLLMTVCDTKQGYTQYGGESRPSHSVWRRGGRIAPGREGAGRPHPGEKCE